MGIHVPNQLRLRNSQHPANEHELVTFKCILATDSTYAGYAEVATVIKHVRWIIAHPVAGFVLPSTTAPIRPAAVLAGVTLEC